VFRSTIAAFTVITPRQVSLTVHPADLPNSEHFKHSILRSDYTRMKTSRPGFISVIH